MRNARSILWCAGLKAEYGEWAIRESVEIVNLLPCGRHKLGHSPMQQWEGKAQNVNRETFGADAYVKLEMDERADRDKLHEVAAGGNGRYRYVGTGTEIGHRAKGSLILDTTTGTLMHRRSYTLNENMAEVRALPFPKPAWPNVPDDELEGETLSESEETDFVDVEAPLDTGERLSPVEPTAKKGGSEGEKLGGAPPQTGALPCDELPLTPAATRWSTSMRSPTPWHAPPEDPEPVRDALKSPSGAARAKASRKAVSKVSGGRRVKSASAKAKGKLILLEFPPVSGDQRISVRWKNPKKKGGLSFDRYEGYKHAKTHDEYLKLGGTRADFKWDGVRGYIHVHRKMGPAGTPPGFGGSVEALADAPLDEWLAANPMINMAHAAQRQKLETAACKAYAAKTLEWWEDRVKSGTGGPEGARALERMLPYWEAHSSFDMSRVEDAAHVLHTLAHEYAQYARVHEDSPDQGEKEMRTITDLAREVHLKVSKGHHAHLVEALKHLRASQMVTPKNYKQAMRGDFREYWEKAVATEVENLTQHRVFQWVPRPPGKHLIDSNWAWKVKTNDLGQISKFKARLVARGFRQVYGIDYADTMAPVGKLTSFRMLLAETARRGMDISFVDIRSAYLKGDLKIKQYMTPPRGVVPPRPGLVMRLDKGLYGLKQSGRRWNERFNLNLLSWGFKVSAADPCLYVKSDGDSEIRVLLFVDDMAIMSDSDAAGQGLRDALIQAVKDEGYEYSSSDDDDVYLGMAVKRINSTSVLLTQERYVRDVMMKFKTADGKSFTDSRRTCSPSPGGKISKRDCPTGDPQSNPEGTRFREICGVLRWIETCTRPDISAALGELSKVQSNPGQVHVEMLDHLMRYVHTTAHHGLLYGGKKQRTADDVLVGYVDSNWAGDCDNYQTRGGYIFTAWQSPVSWASYKFTAVAASSCESEYMSASRAVREASWLRYLLSDLGYGDLTTTNFGSLCDQDFVKVHLSDLVDKSEMPMAVFCDNKAAVAISKNPVLHIRGASTSTLPSTSCDASA